MRTLELDAIEARLNARGGTTGAWWKTLMTVDTLRRVGHFGYDDALFIHYAKDDITALLAEVRRLQAQAQ